MHPMLLVSSNDHTVELTSLGQGQGQGQHSNPMICTSDCAPPYNVSVSLQCSFQNHVNRTITDWNRLPEGAIGTSLLKTHVFRKRVRKVYQ
jgi:hypothetical protein